MGNSWDIVVVNKTDEGYLVMTPNGDTQWLTLDEFEKLQNKLNERRDIHNNR
jgi:hypothetical protein